MTENTRNIAVGLTVLVALVALGGLILMFTGLPGMLQGGYRIEIRTPSTSGAIVGDYVHLGGLRVGRVISIDFMDQDDPMEGITIAARIDQGINVPANVNCYLTRKLMGGVYIELYPDGPQRLDPKTGRAMRFLPKDSVAIVQGISKSMDPSAAFKPAMDSLAKLAESFAKLFPDEEPAPATTAPATTGPAPAPAPPPPGLRGTFTRLDRALDALYAVLGDGENQANIKASMANLREATAQATKSMKALQAFATGAQKAARGIEKLADNASGRIDDLVRKLIGDAEQISKTMETINRAAAKIESGEGTAGKLLNDPQLYNNLLEAAKGLNKLMKDFGLLLKEWKEKGVRLKL